MSTTISFSLMKKSICFASKSKNIEIAGIFVNTICEYEETGEKQFSRVIIAVTESANNAIIHGNKTNAEKEVKLHYFLNNKDISILNIKKKNFDFHARFSAKQRIYKYIIFNQISAPVIEKNRGWHVRKPLDLDLIKKGAKKLIGTHDYSTFRSSSCHAKSPIKTIKSVKIKSLKNKIEIEFKSQSFLQQQVRSMVGCLKYLGEKKWDLKKFNKVFKSKKRVLCAPPAPPEGLFLPRVIY